MSTNLKRDVVTPDGFWFSLVPCGDCYVFTDGDMTFGVQELLSVHGRLTYHYQCWSETLSFAECLGFKEPSWADVGDGEWTAELADDLEDVVFALLRRKCIDVL